MLGRDSDVVPSAKVRFVNPEQFAKASFPIEVTVLGMVMLVNQIGRASCRERV